jgi:hypothetical protein
MRRLPLYLLLLALYVLVVLWPSIEGVALRPHGADMGTYWGAVRVALAGGNPYDLDALASVFREQAGHGSWDPRALLYPPPFLLLFLWTSLLSIESARWVQLGFNQLLLLGVLVLIARWLRARPLPILLAAVLFTPLVDNAIAGQVNLLVLLLIVLAARRPSGSWLALGALVKLSPVILLPWLFLRARWRPVLGFVAVGLALSVLSLALVGPEGQLDCYLRVLPGFLQGEYGENTGDLILYRNHSMLRLWVLLVHGRTGEPDLAVRAANGASLVLLLGATLWRGWRARGAVAVASVAGAFCLVIILAAPYAWEAHLVLAILPVAVTFHALERSALPRRWATAGVVAAAVLMLPMDWLLMPSWLFPELWGPCSSAKTLAVVALWVLCVFSPLAGEEE